MTQSLPIPRDFLARLVGPVAEVVVRDVGGPSDDPGTLAAAARRAVEWLVDAIAEPGPVRPASLAILRDEATATARTGAPVGPLLDRHLTAGWALWEALATAGAAEGRALVELGTRMLRLGDAAAAAIADAYAAAEREAAGRSASARREFLDELLAHRPGESGFGRLARRAGGYGLAAGSPLRIVLAASARELDDDDPVVARLARELGPRAVLVATDRGRLLALVRPTLGPPELGRALGRALEDAAWSAVRVDAPDGLGSVGRTVAEAHATLGAVGRLGLRGEVVAAETLLFERALLADPELLARGVAAVLDPVLGDGPSASRLAATLRSFLETGGNRRETARRLGLAPRTVAYRLGRIESRLGRRLEGPVLLRLAAALFAADLAQEPPPAA